jgi:ribulose-phosphate 3-epimerase
MKVAPSILTADFTKLNQELKTISNADYIHLDIMDGHFVPNISFGPFISKKIAEISTVLLDIHLMVSNPLQWINAFTFDNTAFITVHFEANDFLEAINKIRKNKVGVGISIKPNTSVDEIKPYLHLVDLVLIMTVEPGFGGQSFMPSMMDKVTKLVEMRKEQNLHFQIEVDGGINEDTAPLCSKHGVDIVVAGSYIFDANDREKALEAIK